MARIAVVGGGVAGLGGALALGRRGHEVVILERDDTPLPATADEAFRWDRRGAPQVRHSHALLARLRNLLRDHYPDVLTDLLAAGATELPFGRDLPPTMTGYEREPSDDDLVVIACRRTTFEWVLRRAALAEANIDIRTGAVVTGFTVAGGSRGVVNGLRLEDGSRVDADLVVCAAGRRSALPAWTAAAGGGAVDEEVDDTGIVYLSRFYRFRAGAAVPARNGIIGGDLGYLKYGVFLGDNATFSITLAAPTDDDVLRRALDDELAFDRAASTLTIASEYVDGRAEPITGVHKMAGLVNRWRTWVVDGVPALIGVHPLGDALVCTNPLYGRGCSTGFWHAQLLAEAIDAHPDDPVAQAVAHDEATRREIYPWYRAACRQDREARVIAAAILAGQNIDASEHYGSDQRAFMRSVLRDGLAPALRLDAVVLRAFVRTFNLLSAPDALLQDADLMARVLAVWQARDQRPPEPPLGPPRDELLALLATTT